MNLAEVLDRLVPPAEGRPDWGDVLARRARQRRERALKLSAVALTTLAIVAVPTAWAVGLFRGTPAPESLKSELIHANDDEIAAVLGLMREQPGVDAAKAHGVIELRTSHGPVRLWAAPVRGGGHCSFVQIGEAPADHAPKGITNCESNAPPATAPPIEGGVDPGDGFGAKGLRILHGWVRSELLPVKPTELMLTYTDGTKVEVRLVEDYFLMAIPPGRSAERLTVRSATGQELGSIGVSEAPPPLIATTPQRPERPGPKLIELTLSNGSLARLYGQPRRGPCFSVEVSERGGGSSSTETCGAAWGAVSFGLEGFGGGQGPPEGVLLAGYTRPNVARVEVELAAGRILRASITKGHILLELPRHSEPKAVVSYDSAGRRLERQPI